MREWYEELLEMQAENNAYNREMAEFFCVSSDLDSVFATFR